MSVAVRARERLSGSRVVERVAIAILFGTMLIRIYLIIADWNFGDVEAYWQAALRIRHGQQLYVGDLSPDSYQVFRYAPWFAWLWVPLTYLSRTLVDWGWATILGIASLSILVSLARIGRPAAWAFALLIAPWLLSLVQVGNIQPLVVATLAYGIPRRSGPLWIGIAASLKAVPIGFALVYAARREWWRVALSITAAIVLTAPILFYDLSGYTTDPGRSASLYYQVSPLAWAVAAAVAAVVAAVLAWRRSEYVWVATALAVTLALPRSHITYTTFLAVGLLAGSHYRISPEPDANG